MQSLVLDNNEQRCTITTLYFVKHYPPLPEDEKPIKTNSETAPLEHPGKIRNGKASLEAIAQFADDEVQEKFANELREMKQIRYIVLGITAMAALISFTVSRSPVNKKHIKMAAELNLTKSETWAAKKRKKRALKGKAERDKLVAETKQAILECSSTASNNHDRLTCSSRKLPKRFGLKDNILKTRMRERKPKKHKCLLLKRHNKQFFVRWQISV